MEEWHREIVVETDARTLANAIAALLDWGRVAADDGTLYSIEPPRVRGDEDYTRPLTLRLSGWRMYEEGNGPVMTEDAIGPTSVMHPEMIRLGIVPLDARRVCVTIDCHRPELEAYVDRLEGAIRARWPQAPEVVASKTTGHADVDEPLYPRGKPGRPGLDPAELQYRLDKAAEAEQLKNASPSMTWAEIALEIGWRHGAGPSGLRRLRDARTRLKRQQTATRPA
jgi:hypothetical protein